MSFFKDNDYENKKTTSTFKPYYTIKDNVENVFRIAPPCRSPEYAVYHKVHFGYGVQDSMNPDKTRARPFECIQRKNYKTGLIDVACSECNKIESVKNEMEELQADLQRKGHPVDYVRQATTPQFDWLRNHNLDNKWYCYAKNLAGEWNLLKIGHKTKLALDALMLRLKNEDGIRGLDAATGVWFKFTKNGKKGRDSMTNVEVLREKTVINGQKVEVIRQAPLTQDDETAIAALSDITSCTNKLTYEQIDALVQSGGAPEVAARVFALGQKKEASPAPIPSSTPPRTSGGLAQPPVAPPVADRMVMSTAPVPTPTPSSIDMSPDEFLKTYAKK